MISDLWRGLAICFAFIVFLDLMKACDRASMVVEARELYPGQYQNVDAHIQKWFRSQKIPGGQFKGSLCCSVADGVYVEEDIRGGHYWTKGGPFSDWVPVPDDAVLKDGNPNGSPVLWWYVEGTLVKIRCFAPGGGV